MGIRGGTEREIHRVLRGAGGGRPLLSRTVWASVTGPLVRVLERGRPMAIKRVMRDLFGQQRVTRSTYAGLDLAIEKR
jgi:hypothetical protein